MKKQYKRERVLLVKIAIIFCPLGYILIQAMS